MDGWVDDSLQNELAQMEEKIEKLEMEKLLQGDEIRALKAETRSYLDELESLSHKVKNLEIQPSQETAAMIIGEEVRLRFLEKHRQRMGNNVGQLGVERIKCGDRAAHRGRPVVDALLCLTGLITDHQVYVDLYGLSPKTMKRWKDVPEMVEITGFRASLQSEGKLTTDFQGRFERMLQIVKIYTSPTELREAFQENRILQQLQHELQNCYDSIVAANRRRRNQRQGSAPL
ncbi:MAG: hypothetical protein LQ342_005378 [Letrouitia transgressa]|nr:MAG: hypothetical protein LQ342_005378 [Letrouitia transgressa]